MAETLASPSSTASLLDVPLVKAERRYPWTVIPGIVFILIAGQWLPMIVAPLCLLVAWLIFHQIRRRAVRAALAQQVDAGADTALGILVRDTLKASRFWLGETAAARELVGLLAARGRVGHTVRMCQSSDVTVDPISVSFEALPLDESDSSFAAMASGADVDGGVVDDAVARRIQRTAHLMGGGVWSAFVAFAILLVVSGYAFYMWRRVTSEVILFCLGLTLLMLFGSAGAWTWRKQWLAVPGGLLVRKAGWRQRAWSLHLFRRDASVLLVNEFRNGKWFCTVADADATERAHVTKDEAHFLLRAWLSPVEPPPLERLTDLR